MLSLIVAIILVCIAVVQPFEITANSADIVNKTFSYVIVGGGTAGEPLCCQLNHIQSILSLGLTIANRLTQNPEVTVLVIESGQVGQGDPRLTDPAKSVYFSNFFANLIIFLL